MKEAKIAELKNHLSRYLDHDGRLARLERRELKSPPTSALARPRGAATPSELDPPEEDTGPAG